MFRVTTEPLSAQQVNDLVKRPTDGAVVTFDGIVRNNFGGRPVRYLEYEAYGAMAEKKLAGIGAEVQQKFAVGEIARHRFVNRFWFGARIRINGRLDCEPTEVVIAYRQTASQACSDRARLGAQQSPEVRCIIPVEAEEFRELCRSGFRDQVWPHGEASGTKVLIGWPQPGYKSDVGIGSWGPSVTIVDVPSDHGALDLALMSNGSHLWVLTGDTACIKRVSVISPESGVVGVPSDRVQFRYRWDLDFQPESWKKVTPLDSPAIADLLGAKPDVMLIDVKREFSLAPALALAKGTATSCGNPHPIGKPRVRDGSAAVDPGDIVTDPVMIPFSVRR